MVCLIFNTDYEKNLLIDLIQFNVIDLYLRTSGVVTEFTVNVHHHPETQPVLLFIFFKSPKVRIYVNIEKKKLKKHFHIMY